MEHRGFQGSKTTLYYNGGYIKPIEYATPRMNPNVNQGYRDNGNKCTTWEMGKVMCMWEQGVYGKSLYMPLNFAVNLNCSKNKGLEKKKKIKAKE